MMQYLSMQDLPRMRCMCMSHHWQHWSLKSCIAFHLQC